MATQADYDARVRVLDRMSKASLAALVRQQGNIIWTAHPLTKWNKDELINEVLRYEFPERTT